MKIRNPESEIRKKPEARGPKHQCVTERSFSDFGVRASLGSRISDFGLLTTLLTLLLVPLLPRSLAAEPALASVANPAPVLQELQRKMSSLQSVYLEFTQERHLKLFTEPLKSEGIMLIDRPDKIRWETTAPYQSILLGNQQSVAQFERTDGQWKKLKIGFPQMLRRVMDQMVLMHQGKLDALTSDFKISVATGAVAVLTLEPKDKTVREMLSSLEVRMLPDLSATREVVMHEPSGEFTRIIFQREKRDVKFAPSSFDQTKPLDVAAIRAAVKQAP
jgi:outer membrane lipoprotein-sorting protein